jgi:hypothetical protein
MCVHLVVIIFKTIKYDNLVDALKDEHVCTSSCNHI